MKTKHAFIFSIAGILLTASAHCGSLWVEGITEERGMVADKRAKKVGDILTVVIGENVSMSNSLRLKTDKTAKSGVVGLATDLVNQFIGNIRYTHPAKEIRKAVAANGGKPIDVPTLDANGTNEYNGGGDVKDTQTITARAAVQVIDVLPNGNLVVEGIRQISFSKERQFVTLRGVVRQYDIQRNNTVSSSQVADAQVEIVSEGTLTEAQRKGWLLKLNDKLNPF